MKKELGVAFIILAALLLLFCFLPLPLRIDVTFEGEVEGAATELRLTGWELRYLFLPDRTDIDMEFSKPYSARAPYSIAKLFVTNHPETGRYYSYVAYDRDKNAFISGEAEVEGDFAAITLINLDGENVRFIRI